MLNTHTTHTHRFLELGAELFYPAAEADEVDGLESKVEPWTEGLWAHLLPAVSGAPAAGGKTSSSAGKTGGSDVKVSSDGVDVKAVNVTEGGAKAALAAAAASMSIAQELPSAAPLKRTEGAVPRKVCTGPGVLVLTFCTDTCTARSYNSGCNSPRLCTRLPCLSFPELHCYQLQKLMPR